MKEISRSEAKKLGLKFYFTGKKCIHGHLSKRYIFGGCVECMKMHKSKEDYKIKSRAYSEKYRQEHKETIKKKYKEHYDANLEYHLKRRKDYRLKHQESEKEKARIRKKENALYYSSVQAKRRANQLNATPPWFGELDEFVFEEAFDLAKKRKDKFGVSWEVDHMIPLQSKKACGLHYHKNIQVIPCYLNRSKKNKLIMTTPFEWINYA